jgi:hypothetical protein
MSTVLVEAGDHWRLDVRGAVVDQCCFDYAVVLRMSNGPWELRVEQPFSVTASDGTEHLVVPEEGAHLDVVLAKVLRATVEEGSAFKDGHLELRLDGGTVLRIPPDEGFEAWTVTGPDGVCLVSMPGGDLAIWGSDAPRST